MSHLVFEQNPNTLALGFEQNRNILAIVYKKLIRQIIFFPMWFSKVPAFRMCQNEWL